MCVCPQSSIERRDEIRFVTYSAREAVEVAHANHESSRVLEVLERKVEVPAHRRTKLIKTSVFAEHADPKFKAR